MTVIVRHDNTLYFDDLILTANHVGGTFAKAPHPKVYRHPNFNALIGVSGAIAGNIFNKINAVITQWLTELKEDIHAPLDLEALEEIQCETLLTIGIFCKDFTVVLHVDGEPKKKSDWRVYKHPVTRPMVIGAGSSVLHFIDDFTRAMSEDPMNGIRLILGREIFGSCNWKSLDITNLGEL